MYAIRSYYALVIAHQKYSYHVDEDSSNEKVAADDMHLSEQPAIGHPGHDLLHAPERMISMRDIIDQKADACYHLDQIPHNRNSSEGMEEIDIAGNAIIGQVASDELIEPDPHFQPVPYPLGRPVHPITNCSLSTLSGTFDSGRGGGPERTVITSYSIHYTKLYDGGTYDLEGNVLSGPPPRPLSKVPLKVESEQLVIG